MTSPSLNLGVPISGLGGITSTGSDQASAYQLVIEETSFSSSPPGTGSRLPGPNNNELTVFNEDAVNAHTLYPGVGDRIGANAINAFVTIPASSAAKIASFDTPQTPQPRTWHIMATGGGGGGGGGIGTLTAGANITVTNPNGPNATIAATGLTGVSSVIAQGGPFLANGTITAAGTINNSTASLATHGVLIGEGTGAVVAAAAMTNGQLLIGATGADPAPQTMSGDATINSGGTIAVSKVGGATPATVAGLGLNLNNGTMSAHAQITVAATVGINTLTLAAATTNVLINGPAAGGAVTITLPASAGIDQRIVMNVSQGATAATWTFNGATNIGTTVPSPTITAVAGKRDNMVWINNVGTVFDLEAINQGFSP